MGARNRFALAAQATPAYARAWRAMLSPSPALLDGARDGGVAERLKAHAWKVSMRETVS